MSAALVAELRDLADAEARRGRHGTAAALRARARDLADHLPPAWVTVDWEGPTPPEGSVLETVRASTAPVVCWRQDRDWLATGSTRRATWQAIQAYAPFRVLRWGQPSPTAQVQGP